MVFRYYGKFALDSDYFNPTIVMFVNSGIEAINFIFNDESSH